MIVSQMSIYVANWDLGAPATEGGSYTCATGIRAISLHFGAFVAMRH